MSTNPSWRREELVLALDLYMKRRGALPSKGSKEVADLSQTLNRLASSLGLVAGDERFRNEAGVYMKLMNFLPHDPLYQGVGLRAGGRLDGEVWDEFADNPDELQRAAAAIRSTLEDSPEAGLAPPGSASLEGLKLLAEKDIGRRNLKRPDIRMRGLASVVSLLSQAIPWVAGDTERLRRWPKHRLVPKLEKVKGRRLNGAESSALSILLAQLGADARVDWGHAVLRALRRFAKRRQTRKISRQDLLREERERILKETRTRGVTPDQTVSRVLQDLRDEGALYFLGRGTYLLLDTPMDVEAEGLSDRALDFAAGRNKLRFGAVDASSEEARTRRRKGQDKVRSHTLHNYGRMCAFCDVTDERLLVAGHISRWADDPKGRGDLTNVICMCRLHDALFETGYLALSDDLGLLRGGSGGSSAIAQNLDTVTRFRSPSDYPPDPKFLRKHRERVRLSATTHRR